jgi:hypothetical protein
MAATPRTTASRAAKTAGPGEITVPIMGVLTPVPDRTDDYEIFVRDLRGHPIPAWSATKIAGMVLISTPGLLSVEMWIAPGYGTPNVTLARFTRRRAGTIPAADTIGAVRLGPGAVALVEPDEPIKVDETGTE